MAEKEKSSVYRISSAIGAERQSRGTADRSSLSDTLVKSPEWKKNTLQRIEALRSGDSHGTAHQDACQQDESKSLRETLALQAEDMEAARRQLHKQSAALQRRRGEIEQLRQAIVKLEAEKARLTAEHQDEVDAKRVELLDLQEAYDQFEQQSDLLLNELDQQNERLRAECKVQNRRSIL